MNKTELVETIAQRTDISKKDVQAVLDTFEDIAGDVVAKGKEALTIPGVLKFEQTHRAARTGRNPQTGETIQVAAANAAKVTAGAKLKARAKSGK
jgi:DNA-binding protein HU-beta